MSTVDPTEIELPDVLDSQVQPQAVFGANGAQGVPRNPRTLNIIFSNRSFVEKMVDFVSRFLDFFLTRTFLRG
jgi:hypothetical protein